MLVSDDFITKVAVAADQAPSVPIKAAALNTDMANEVASHGTGE